MPEARGEARDKAAAFTGRSGRTLEKASAIVEAAEAEPEKFGKLVDDMDRTGLANGLRAGYEKHKGALIGSRIAPEMKSQIIADAARYAIKHFPDATNHFGVEKPEHLADLAAALLPKIEAERPAAASTPAGGAMP